MKKFRKIRIATLCVGLIAGSAAPANELIESHLFPLYEELNQALNNFEKSRRVLCEPTLENNKNKKNIHLNDFHAPLNSVIDAWMQIEHLRFGPVMNDMRNYKLYFWPDKRRAVAKQTIEFLKPFEKIGQTVKQKEQTLNLQNASIAVQGIQASEFLIYEHAPKWKQEFLNSKGKTLICEFLLQANKKHISLTHDVLNEWKTLQKKHATRESKAKEITSWFFQALYEQLAVISDQKLKAPIEEKNTQRAFRLADGWRSSRVIRNLKMNISSLAKLFHKDLFFDRLITQDKSLGPKIRTTLKNISSVLEEIPDSEKIFQGESRKKLSDVLQMTQQLVKIVESSLSKELDIPIGFNSMDGD